MSASTSQGTSLTRDRGRRLSASVTAGPPRETRRHAVSVPAPAHHKDDEHLAARAIVERHGHDSIAPFVLRPDKRFHFAAGGLVAYRVIGRTAIVSGDPVGPDDAMPRLLAGFHEHARRHRWGVVVWGASDRYLQHYRHIGLREVCAGEEAVIEPAAFSLNGRPVRKLRQSVNRVERRGWAVSASRASELDAALRAEIDSFERTWRAEQPRLLGFAMSFGAFEAEARPDDLYLLGRSPEGDLRAVMRFIAHCGKLSLDTMHRVGESPNGLNEALVCRALQLARESEESEVSLNYAGLGHLVRGERPQGRVARVALDVLARRFQMERLVCFNEKFFPEWRPRFLLCSSRIALPKAVVRVLQVEGHLPAPAPSLRPSAQA